MPVNYLLKCVIVPLFCVLPGIAGIVGGTLMLVEPRLGLVANGVTLVFVGLVSIAIGIRIAVGQPPGVKKSKAGPDFRSDDPAVAGLPPTTTTRLVDKIKSRRDRERETRGGE